MQSEKSPTETLIPSRNPRYLSLDIWRGIACLAVTVYHLAGDNRFIDGLPAVLTKVLGFGWVGVPMFFVISGYCIAATTDSASRNSKSFYWYLQRRFRRIYPPYWICLGVLLIAMPFGVLGSEIHDPRKFSLIHWLGNFTLTESWLGRLADGAASYVLIPAWTLCYEEQFYLICGLVLCFFRSRIFTALLAVSLIVVPVSLIFWYTNGKAHGFFFDGLWLQFAIGVLIYYLRVRATKQGRLLGIAVLLASFGLVVLLRVFTPPDIINGLSRCRFFDGTAFSILFAFALLAGEKYDGQIAVFWLMKPLMACGAMCYSLYLTHLPVISFMRLFAYRSIPEPPLMHWVDAMLTFIATLVIGAFFYWFVERRFLNKPTVFSTPSFPKNHLAMPQKEIAP